MTLPHASSFVVRPAVLQDLDSLAAIDALCFPAGIAYPRKEIASLLRAHSILTVVAERGAIIAGFAALSLLHRKGSRHGELITIDVLPEFRRKHIGGQLHRVLEEWLGASNGRSIRLHVAVDNASALQFYEQLGYRILERVPRYYLHTMDAWKMEKLLV
jgi:ribosomal-protein-alanine N-acetyltransferase